MMSKSFISYCHENDDKRLILHKLLRDHRLCPIVVASRNKPSMLLATKVEQAIEEADYLIPILTQRSLSNQWVNQEIGYANKLAKENKIRIVPIVEESVMDSLKGFIHKQMDLPFIFKGSSHNGVENKAFKAQCIRLIQYLKTSIAPRKRTVDLNATISRLSLNESNAFLYDSNLQASIVLENIGNVTITIREIKFALLVTFNPYKSFGKKGTTRKNIIYESSYYEQNYKTISPKSRPIILKPREVRNIYELNFMPSKPINKKYKFQIYKSLRTDFPVMSSLQTTFVFLSGETFEKEVKVLSVAK